MNINDLLIVLIKVRLLIFLVFSQYEFPGKYGIILQISIFNWMQDRIFFDTWSNICQSGKAITET